MPTAGTRGKMQFTCRRAKGRESEQSRAALSFIVKDSDTNETGKRRARRLTRELIVPENGDVRAHNTMSESLAEKNRLFVGVKRIDTRASAP